MVYQTQLPSYYNNTHLNLRFIRNAAVNCAINMGKGSLLTYAFFVHGAADATYINVAIN